MASGLIAIVREARIAMSTEAGSRGASLALIKSGLADLRGSAALRRLVALSVLSNPMDFLWIALYQPLLAQSATPSAWFGPALAGGSLLAALVEGNAERIERWLPKRIALPALLLAPAVLYLALAVPHASWLAVALFMLHKGVMYAAQPLLGAYTNAHLTPASRATTLSMISFISTAYQALIGVPLGWLAQYSLGAWCVAVAAVIAISALTLTRAPSQKAPAISS
jgi:hypothetical protein